MRQPDLSTARVLVVGDTMLDVYVRGSTSRISPEAPVPVVRVSQEDDRIGGAGNVALNVATLGAASALIGLVGDDAAADRMARLLQQQGVRCALQRVPGVRTITKQRVLSRNQQLIRLDFEDAFTPAAAAGLRPDFEALLGGVDSVIVSDYDKGTLHDAATLIGMARARGLPVVVDPKGTDFTRYRGATVVTPNLSEFELVAGRCATEEALIERGQRLRADLGLEALLITRSERGMTLLAQGRAPLHLPTRAQEVFDVTGAGDTVVAVLGACLAARVPMVEAVALANVAAGIVVAKLGTATVTPAELRAALRGSGAETLRRGVQDEAALLEQVDLARGRGDRLVMTHGSFDGLDADHLDHLERARAQGDRLIVAVNDDDAVRRLQGAARPVHPLAARQRMLAALVCVDWVVACAEDTPARLAGAVQPDVWVDGSHTVDGRSGMPGPSISVPIRPLVETAP